MAVETEATRPASRRRRVSRREVLGVALAGGAGVAAIRLLGIGAPSAPSAAPTTGKTDWISPLGGESARVSQLLRRVAFGCDGAGRNRLDPGHLRQGVQVRLDRLARGPEIHRPRPALAGVQHVEADVRRDPVEPRAQRCTALEAVETSPGAEQGLLHGVLGLERRAEHSVAVGGELRTVLFELFLCVAVLDTE